MIPRSRVALFVAMGSGIGIFGARWIPKRWRRAYVLSLRELRLNDRRRV